MIQIPYQQPGEDAPFGDQGKYNVGVSNEDSDAGKSESRRCRHGVTIKLMRCSSSVSDVTLPQTQSGGITLGICFWASPAEMWIYTYIYIYIYICILCSTAAVYIIIYIYVCVRDRQTDRQTSTLRKDEIDHSTDLDTWYSQYLNCVHPPKFVHADLHLQLCNQNYYRKHELTSRACPSNLFESGGAVLIAVSFHDQATIKRGDLPTKMMKIFM